MRSVLLGALCLAVAAQAAPEQAEERFRFAESLRAEGDHYRAITEFKRAAFLAPGTPLEQEALLAVALVYKDAGKWEAAEAALDRLAAEGPQAERGAWERAEVMRLAREEGPAAEAYEAFLKRFPASARADEARLRQALCLARTGELARAREALGGIPGASPLKAEADRAAARLDAPGELAPKSPALAGALSAVLPGSGQWYAGKPASGAVYFVLTGGLVAASVESYHTDRDVLGTLLALVALTVYGSGVQGAMNDAHRANREAEEGFLRGLEGERALPEASLPGPALVWTLRF